MTPQEFPEVMPPPLPAPMNEAARLVNVFFSPGKAFADIALRPRWWVPVVLSMIVTTAMLYQFSQRIGWELFFRQQAAQNTQLQNMPAAQRAQLETIQVAIGKYLTWGAGLVGPILSALILALVLLFLANTVMGGGVKFKNMLAAVTYGTLPNLIKTGLAILVMQLKPPDEFDLQNRVMVNLSLFVPQDAARWMTTLGASFDLFTFWSMALIAIGIAAASKRLTAGKAFGMMLFPWALWVILVTGAAALRS